MKQPRKMKRWGGPPVSIWLVLAWAALTTTPGTAADAEQAETEKPREIAGEPPAPGPFDIPEEVMPRAYRHFCVGMRLMRGGDTEGAFEEFRQVVRLDPGARQAWFHLGSLRRARAEFEQAEENFAKAVGLDPDNFRYHFELGRVQLLAGKADEVISHWEKAAERAEGGSAAYIYHRIARYYQRKNDDDKAIEALKKALAASGKPMRIATQLVALQETREKWAGAIETYEHMLDLQPKAIGLHVKIAACHQKLAQWKEAVAAYDAYFAADPPNIDSYAVLARAIAAAQKAKLPEKAQAYLQESVNVLNKALEEGSKDTATFSRFAALLMRAGETQTVVDTFKKGLESASGPAAVAIHEVLSNVYLREGLPDEAEAEILAAIQLEPDDPKLHAALASFCVDMLRFEAAAAAFLKAVELAESPQRMAYRAGLAEVYREIKEYDKATGQIDAIVKEDSESAAAWAGLGQVRKEAGKLDAAAEALLKAIKLGAPNLQVETKWRLDLAEVCVALEKAEQAQQQYARIEELADDAITVLSVGYVLFANQSYEKATDLLKANMDEMGDVKAAARSLLSTIHQKQGNNDLAEKELQQMLEENPGNARGYRELASFFEKQKRYAEARKMLQKALEIDDSEGQQLLTRLSLASVLSESGRPDLAEKKYREVLEEYPDQAIVNNNFSYFYAMQGRELESALKMVKKALQTEPESAAYLDTLGWVLYKMGRHKGAVLKTNQAYRRQNDAVIAEHLGDALLKLGRKRQALEKYERALQLDPGSEELIKKVEEIAESIESTQAQ